jgi:hypothetical protein
MIYFIAPETLMAEVHSGKQGLGEKEKLIDYFALKFPE